MGKSPVALEPWNVVKLISAGGASLNVHGHAHVTLAVCSVSLWRSLLQGKETGDKPSLNQRGNVRHSALQLLQLWNQLVVSRGILCRRYESTDGSCVTLQSIVLQPLRKDVHDLCFHYPSH